MWIETDDQLVNTANIDTIFISNTNDVFFLIAQKNFNDFQVAEYVLAEGSKQAMETQYKRVRDAARSGDHFVKVVNGKQKTNSRGLDRAAELAQPPETLSPAELNTETDTCPDCGHPLAWHATAAHAPNGGVTCAEPGCRCEVFGIAKEAAAELAETETCPDCDHPVSRHVEGPGHTCLAFGCTCTTSISYLTGDDLFF